MGSMRRWATLGGACFAALAVGVGCAKPETPRPDELVIRLGGDAPSLSGRLGLRAVPARPPRVDPEPRPETPSEPVPPAAEPQPTPAAPAGPRFARLGRGQTLYRLAVEHLGSGARWREIMVLNGWTEDDLAALPAGTRVRLPAR